MNKKEIKRLLKKERYRYCESSECGKRFQLGSSETQKYCRASCYKAHRRQKAAEKKSK